jgi:dihydroceramidase
MHLLITPLLYRILTFKASLQRTYVVGTILSIVFTVVMVVHMVADEFLLHATSFGTEVYLVANRSMAIIRKSLHTHTKEPLRSLAIFGCGESPHARPGESLSRMPR